eukprot:TCONS_00012580-protein
MKNSDATTTQTYKRMLKKGCLRALFQKRTKTQNSTNSTGLSRGKMRERDLTSRLSQIKCNHDQTLMRSYSLDFTPTKRTEAGEKVYIMYVAFILKGKYILAVQRKTKKFNTSTFQAILWEANEVKEEVESLSNSRQELLTVSMNDDIVWSNQTFDLNFTEIHQVHVSDGHKLTIVGCTGKNSQIIQQFNFITKTNSDKGPIRMKSEFVLSLTSKKMAIKKKTSIPVLGTLDIPEDCHANVVALTCESGVTSFVYQITSFTQTRWIVCLYNGNARKTTQQFHYYELTSNIVRGAISSACLLNNKSKLVLVTTAFQLLTLDIEKNGLSLRSIRLLSDQNLMFESDYQNIFLQKLNYKCLETDENKELVIACSTAGRLFFIPECINSFNTEIHSFDVASVLDIGDDQQFYVQQFTSCDFTKQCVLTCRSGRVYTFDILKKTVVQKTKICTETGDSSTPDDFTSALDTDFYYQLIDLNSFGDELYHLQDNRLHVHLMKSSQTSLEQIYRVKILDNLPIEEIMKSNVSTLVKRIVS